MDKDDILIKESANTAISAYGVRISNDNIRVLFPLTNYKSGFAGIAKVDDIDKRVFVGNCGTNSLLDLLSWAMVPGLTPISMIPGFSQVNDSRSFTIQVENYVSSHNEYSGYKIIQTGQSWGETLAQINSWERNQSGVGLDGPGAWTYLNSTSYLLNNPKGLSAAFELSSNTKKIDFISLNASFVGGWWDFNIPGTRSGDIDMGLWPKGSINLFWNHMPELQLQKN
jgi:hypothetical protein